MKLILKDDDGIVGPEVEVSAAAVQEVAESDHAPVYRSWTALAEALAAAMPRPRVHPQPGDLLRRNEPGSLPIVVLDVRDGFVYWSSDNFLVCDDGLDPDAWDHIPAADIPWPERGASPDEGPLNHDWPVLREKGRQA